MSGARLPFALLACFGLLALRSKHVFARKPAFILAMIIAVSVEFHVPVRGNIIDLNRVTYLDALAEENDGQISIINLPMGRTNSKFYLFYQSLSGYPQTEGAISRTPDSAYDYIRANYILETWHSQRPIACTRANVDTYMSALDQLEADGFSHVVFHQNVGNRLTVVDSFVNAIPSYKDDFVWIFRLDDLRDSCPNRGES